MLGVVQQEGLLAMPTDRKSRLPVFVLIGEIARPQAEGQRGAPRAGLGARLEAIDRKIAALDEPPIEAETPRAPFIARGRHPWPRRQTGTAS
jgi:hypothetical protein